MDIANNVLKHYLQNVYFFCGTACGGKSTISKAFAEKHGFLLLDEETLNDNMQKIANPAFQPAWCGKPDDWNEYFNRPYKEYHEWLEDCLREQLPMALMELIRISANQPVAADVINMPISLAKELAEPNRIVFLVTTPEIAVRDYFNRPSHKPIYDCIMRTRDPEASLANVKKMLAYGIDIFLKEIKNTDLFYIQRDDNSTVENTLSLVEKHFGLN